MTGTINNSRVNMSREIMEQTTQATSGSHVLTRGNSRCERILPGTPRKKKRGAAPACCAHLLLHYSVLRESSQASSKHCPWCFSTTSLFDRVDRSSDRRFTVGQPARVLATNNSHHLSSGTTYNSTVLREGERN